MLSALLRLHIPMFCLVLLWPLPGGAACGQAAESIHRIKGYQGTTFDAGQQVTVEGVVTGAFPARAGINGFWMQHESREGGRLPAGIFVYLPEADERLEQLVTPGRRLRFEARTSVFRGQQQLTRVGNVTDCGNPGLPEAVELVLPATIPLSRLEGLKLEFPQTLTVSGTRQLARYGTLALSADGRVFQPTNFVVAEVEAHRGRRVILDDGSYHSWPEPLPWLDQQGTRRVGSEVEGLVGVLAWAFGDYRVHPLRPPRFVEANPRPRPPPSPAPQAVRVAAFNLQNYFMTPGERGADNRAAFKRQRARLVAALRALDADVAGLIEVENRPAAVMDLLDQLNRGLPENRQYRHLDGSQSAGDDAIRVALIYRPARLEALGPLQRDTADVHLRPPATGRFRAVTRDTDDEPGPRAFAVTVMHSKSKIRCPPAGDVDLGQGCWNRLRTRQSRALLDFAGRFDEPLLVVGDINAYGGEDPVQVFTGAGFVDLIAAHLPREQRYSYVHRGQSGYLDHLLAQPRLAAHVQRAGIWHINADEPWFLGYDGPRYRTASGRVFRSSDHDPVWVDLCLRQAGGC